MISCCGSYHADKVWKCMLLSNAAAIGGWEWQNGAYYICLRRG